MTIEFETFEDGTVDVIVNNNIRLTVELSEDVTDPVFSYHGFKHVGDEGLEKAIKSLCRVILQRVD